MVEVRSIRMAARLAQNLEIDVHVVRERQERGPGARAGPVDQPAGTGPAASSRSAVARFRGRLFRVSPRRSASR